MPSYYYAAPGLLILVLLLLVMRAQKAKAAKVVAPTDIHEGWLPTSVATATPEAWANPVPESKRQARARARSEAKAEAKSAADAKALAKTQAKAEAKAAKTGVPVPVQANAADNTEAQPAKARRHRRSKNSVAEVATTTASDEAPALISQDGWLTTAVDDATAAPQRPQPTHEVRDLFQPPTPAFAVPQQHAPAGPPPAQEGTAYAMAGAPAQHAHAAVAAPPAPPAAAPTNFTELMTAPPAPPVAVAPELPLGPYTYGARTILPGK